MRWPVVLARCGACFRWHYHDDLMYEHVDRCAHCGARIGHGGKTIVGEYRGKETGDALEADG